MGRYLIDTQGVLICDTAPSTPKQLNLTFEGVTLHSPDIQLPVLHKKLIKILPLKQVGSGQGVFCVAHRDPLGITKRNSPAGESASAFNAVFDENTGRNIHLLPSYNNEKAETLQKCFHLLGLKYALSRDEHKGWILESSGPRKLPTTIEEVMSILAMFYVIYGKRKRTGDQVSSLTFQIPLIGDRAQKLHFLDTLKNICASHHIFRTYTLQEGKVTTAQRTVHDDEIVEGVSFLLKPLESLLKIRTLSHEQERKTLLCDYLIQEGNNEEIISIIQKSRIKLIQK